ncbi:MAG: hypothetical protein IJF65_02430 [Clostridia bacterium]|nr:hypothetical protein [Clostridia bacterium]
MIRFNRMDDQQAPKKREEEQRLAFSPALSAGGAAALRPQSTIRPQASVTPSKAPQAPRENPYEPLVQLAKKLPANTPAHQLAQRPITTRQEGINLYNALSPKLDSHRRRTVDHYFASLAGQKLKNIGIPQPPRDLTHRLSQVWLGQNPEENARTIMQKYPYSQGVLEEVMEDRDASSTPIAYEMKTSANHGMTEELKESRAGKTRPDEEFFETSAYDAQNRAASIDSKIPDNDWLVKESALTDYDKQQGIKVIEADGELYYDYTEPINRLLERSLDAFKSSNVKGLPPKDFMIVLDRLLWFKDQVDNGMPWDLKVDEPWKQQFGDLQMPAFGDEFYFRGKRITRENLGNLTYGYLGSVMGVPPDILYGMGGAVHMKASDTEDRGLVYWLGEALKAGEEHEYLDGKNDYLFVKMGVEMYQSDFKE